MENNPFISQITPPLGVVDVEGVDVTFSRRSKENIDRVGVKIALAFGRHGAHAFEARVGDIEGLARGGKGDAVRVVEGVFDDRDGAGGGAEAVGCQSVGGGIAAEFEAVAIICSRRC